VFVWLVADGWWWFVLREKYCWLVADGWWWFVLREKYCWLVADGWFVLREKYCCLVADKPSEILLRICTSLGFCYVYVSSSVTS
jgi:hypothetical protein